MTPANWLCLIAPVAALALAHLWQTRAWRREQARLMEHRWIQDWKRKHGV